MNEYCYRGNLASILRMEKLQLDYMMRFSMALDVACGMEYLHKMDIIHGALTSASCWLDTKWTVKVTDWEYHVIANTLQSRPNSEVRLLSIFKLIWFIFSACMDNEVCVLLTQ